MNEPLSTNRKLAILLANKPESQIVAAIEKALQEAYSDGYLDGKRDAIAAAWPEPTVKVTL